MSDTHTTLAGYGDRLFAFAEMRNVRLVDDVPMARVPTIGLPTVCIDMANGETARVPFIRRENAEAFASLIRRFTP